MKYAILTTTFIIGLISLPFFSFSQRFVNYSMKDGLSANFVRKIIQDRQGFIWIATVNGLNRFDGYEFKTFKHDKDDSTSISNNNLYDLLEDEEGNIWVASLRGGLNCYHPDTESFTRYRFDAEDSTSISSDEVISLYQDKKGTIWIGTYRQLNIMVKDAEGNVSFERVNSTDQDPGGKISSVYSISEDNFGNIWLGGPVGLIRYDPEKRDFRNYHYWPGLKSKPSSAVPYQIIKDKKGNLWVANQPGGFEKVSFHSEKGVDSITVKFTPFHTLPYPENAQHNRIRSLLIDKNDQLWIGSYKGIFLSQSADSIQNLINYTANPDEDGYFNSDLIWTMFEDQAGNIWLGSPRGLSMLPAHQYAFHSIKNEPDNPQSLRGPIVGSAIKDKLNYWWVSTQKGLSRINRETNEFLHFTYPDKLAGSVIGSMALDSENRLYLADYGAVSRIDDVENPQLTHFRHRSKEPGVLGTHKTFSVFVDQDDRPWFTSYRGILTINPDNDSLELCPFDSANAFTHILAKGKDSLWAASQLGLMAFDKKTRTFHKQDLGEGYENEVIKFIHQSSQKSHTLWMATQTGLHKFKMGEGIIRSYGEKDGICNAFVTNIQEDDNGNLWIGTNNGLSRFNQKDEEFFNYRVEDGIPDNFFVNRSSYKDEEGNMYFGTASGLLYFHPKEIISNTFIPPVQITEFRLFNEPVLISKINPQVKSHNYSLSQSISQTQEITLNYRQRVISFSFAALNYHIPENNQMVYKMEGFDEDWVYSRSNQRLATYTNLDPGTYTFRVKGSNNDGVWNEEGASIQLNIRPPWYKTNWAYFLYACMAGLLIWAFVRYRTEEVRRELATQSRIEKAKLTEREKVRARSSRDFHDEAGNKLTKISLYTGLMKQQLSDNPQFIEFLDGIENNIKGLSSGMRDFIWVLDPKQDSLAATLLRIKQFGDGLFEHSGIEFQFSNSITEEEDLALNLNTRRHLLMIFKEAMNNALKYAKAGTVKLSASIESESLQISLSDDGLGFDSNNLARVNGLNNMKSRAEESGGRLEVKGVPGMGTSVVFQQEI